MSHATVEERLTRLETEMKEIKPLAKLLNELNTQLQLMNQSMTLINNNQEEMKSDIEELKEKPSKQMAQYKLIILTAGLTTAANFAMTYFIQQIVR